ncbi:iron ABC transporter permease [Tsukamurella sp. 8F]|uniref:FecCD family ABC transporter permease n=1 Tax=unclassified Tsukamurella TaxID=2633480 RepID=UPI0023B96830|nr:MULTISPECIES: iron ABC transporter permease [unclassified Tsukamurella]MDF0528780.1 iron ABC transporter permease [Tsukamurella sp. 8J]MDF0586615.1 iron ABC transporter permease [Tsukamurella sp. 8F]
MASSSADLAPTTTPDAPRRIRRALGADALLIAAFTALLLVVAVAALAVGRYTVPPNEIVRMLAGQVLPITRTWYPREQSVVLDVRLPRVVLSILIGAGLSLTGAVMQAVFRNPLASAQILGVSSGASFGGVLTLLFGLGSAALVSGAFLGGVLALVLVLAIARAVPGAPLLMIILGGTVVGAMFQAMVSFITYIADPYSQLPSIVFWLMGSLASASYSKVLVAAIPIIPAAVVMLALRWRVNILSMGDEDASAIGVRPQRLRIALLMCVALVTAGSVSVAGVVSWVGLVVPHLVRMIVGTDNRRVMPISALLGAAYLTAIDTLSRTISSAEIPIGILTAIIGAPFFVALLVRNRNRLWGSVNA